MAESHTGGLAVAKKARSLGLSSHSDSLLKVWVWSPTLPGDPIEGKRGPVTLPGDQVAMKQKSYDLKGMKV